MTTIRAVAHALRPVAAAALAAAAVTGALVAGAVGQGTASAATSATVIEASSLEAHPTVWLCRPGAAHDPCLTSQTTTVVGADGSTKVVTTEPAAEPKVDCFYVYPTVSAQPTTNANYHIDPEETAIAVAQASRFSSVCRVWAPVYPQLTLSAIGGTGLSAQAVSTAYEGVQSAWLDYLAHDNHGRPVVFIGHSQGAAMLIQLLKAQVDPVPSVRKKLVSAIILGGNVTVPVGKTVGGDFAHIPACRSAGQTGCVIAYSSFSTPPPADSLFGRVGTGVSALSGQQPASALQVLCVNPAALGGGSGTLEPYFPTAAFPGPLGANDPGLPYATPWVSDPDLYRAQCEYRGGASWLQVDSEAGPGDHRPIVPESLGPTWGLHLEDVNLALGNLVGIVRSEAAAYRG